MKIYSSLIFASSLGQSITSVVGQLAVGDSICITGYITDNLCINQGFFLDKQDVSSLGNPEQHSFHCLLDPPQCPASGFAILGPKDESTGNYCVAFQLPDDTEKIVADAAAVGRSTANGGNCDACSGGADAPTDGYMATIKGTIKDMGDGTPTGVPHVTIDEILPSTTACEGGDTVIEVCGVGVPPDTTTTSTTEDDQGDNVDVDNDDGSTQVELGDDYEMSYIVDEAAGTVTMEVKYDGNAWVGIGLSDGGMVPGEAVIGQPNAGTVQQYDLTGKSSELVTPSVTQTLTDATVGFTEDEGTVMKFTMPLTGTGGGQFSITLDGGSTATNMIWAHGDDGVTDLQYHNANRGSVSVTFIAAAAATEETTEEEGAQPSPAPTPAAAGGETEPAPAPSSGASATATNGINTMMIAGMVMMYFGMNL